MGDSKNYVDWNRTGAQENQRGKLGSRLVEFLPKYAKRPGDVIYEGENNTYIVLGRDRPGWRRPDGGAEDYSRGTTQSHKDLNSGYGDEMAAGAIDIVVGRMAPYPFEEFPSNANPGSRQIDVGPQFNAEYREELSSLILGDGGNDSDPRTTVIMDAARVYISQKTDADSNFKISPCPPGTDLVGRRSAIVSKADHIRLFGREDIKIVTGGPGTHERLNSQGAPIARQMGIHLMAGNGFYPNGNPNRQEPIPKGERLVNALEKLVKMVDQINGTLTKFMFDQNIYNQWIGSHTHVVAPGTIAAPDFVLSALYGYVGPAALQGNTDLMLNKTNLANWQLNHLKRSGSTYINSMYNTVN